MFTLCILASVQHYGYARQLNVKNTHIWHQHHRLCSQNGLLKCHPSASNEGPQNEYPLSIRHRPTLLFKFKNFIASKLSHIVEYNIRQKLSYQSEFSFHLSILGYSTHRHPMVTLCVHYTPRPYRKKRCVLLHFVYLIYFLQGTINASCMYFYLTWKPHSSRGW